MVSDKEYMETAAEISSYSQDPSTKVGAVVVGPTGNIGKGYNSFPTGVEETQERMDNREEKYPRVVHAEMNAIISAYILDLRVEEGTMYTTHFPCSTCCGVMIQFGIKRIVTYEPDPDYLSRWKKSVDISMSMLNESGIELTYIPR